MIRLLILAGLLLPSVAHAQAPALTYEDRSGTITAGGTAQVVLPAWTTRRERNGWCDIPARCSRHETAHAKLLPGVQALRLRVRSLDRAANGCDAMSQSLYPDPPMET